MVRREEIASPPVAHKILSDWTHLIIKLRWIGLDEEAQRLELAVSTLPPEMRCGRGGPFGDTGDTDRPGARTRNVDVNNSLCE
jgi:hypothetical protein